MKRSGLFVFVAVFVLSVVVFAFSTNAAAIVKNVRTISTNETSPHRTSVNPVASVDLANADEISEKVWLFGLFSYDDDKDDDDDGDNDDKNDKNDKKSGSGHLYNFFIVGVIVVGILLCVCAVGFGVMYFNKEQSKKNGGRTTNGGRTVNGESVPGRVDMERRPLPPNLTMKSYGLPLVARTAARGRRF
ncbi:hypothetical protein L596_011775 [Steinernema carpocapsae]|uniref:Transmembrane protein n=1 Tax=Steinernema carpocapsae TaxID=34508 RepID=A0A4U5NV01_STECR|nr:hypothetical protein L596_011775 [Steinernema carpocapsae]